MPRAAYPRSSPTRSVDGSRSAEPCEHWRPHRDRPFPSSTRWAALRAACSASTSAPTTSAAKATVALAKATVALAKAAVALAERRSPKACALAKRRSPKPVRSSKPRWHAVALAYRARARAEAL